MSRRAKERAEHVGGKSHQADLGRKEADGMKEVDGLTQRPLATERWWRLNLGTSPERGRGVLPTGRHFWTTQFKRSGNDGPKENPSAMVAAKGATELMVPHWRDGKNCACTGKRYNEDATRFPQGV